MRLARLRAAAQLLHRPDRLDDPAGLARAIAGAQAQDKRAGLLQFRARSRRFDAARVERARVEERSLTRGWLMRGTVHLVATDDYRWMMPLFAEATARESRRRLAQLGLDGPIQERALELTRTALASDGALTRNAVAERLERAGIEVAPESRVHLMRVVVSEGVACIGPDEGAHGTLVLTEEWLGRSPRVDRDQALAELARRYLAAFAPASERDFAKWSGLPLRDCRRGLERIASELVEVGAARGMLAPRDVALRAPRSPVVRLLGAFDTYLMGYEVRRHAVGEAEERRILPGGGVLRPTICVDGRLVGVWASKRSGRRLAVTLDPFEPLPDEWLAKLEDEVAEIGRFEGLEATLAAG